MGFTCEIRCSPWVSTHGYFEGVYQVVYLCPELDRTLWMAGQIHQYGPKWSHFWVVISPPKQVPPTAVTLGGGSEGRSRVEYRTHFGCSIGWVPVGSTTYTGGIRVHSWMVVHSGTDRQGSTITGIWPKSPTEKGPSKSVTWPFWGGNARWLVCL